MTRKLSRLIGVSTIAAIAGLAIAATASAHVEVEADGDAVAGQPARLVFRVPNERDDAATVTIEIQMPQDVDLTDVVADEVEGWTITTTTRDGDIVDTITWDATGPGLVGEDSVELPVAVGPLPAVESLTFPTVQTYDDGEVVRWIEPAPRRRTRARAPRPDARDHACRHPRTRPRRPNRPNRLRRCTGTDGAGRDAGDRGGDARDRHRRRARHRDHSDTATVTAATEVSTSSTAVEADDDDGSTVWPWVVAGIIVLVVVVVVGGTVIARRRTSG